MGWPTVSPETQDYINQSKPVQQLVQHIIVATQDYLADWNQELLQMHQLATREPLQVMLELVNSVQEASEQLGEFRGSGLEFQLNQIGELLQRTEAQDADLELGGKP